MISEIQTINRFLASVFALEADKKSRDVDVAEYYTTQYLYAIRDDFAIGKNFCADIGFITPNKNHSALSGDGRFYLNLGNKKDGKFILEPNKKQKKFLSEKLLGDTGAMDLFKKLLYNFNKGDDGDLFLSEEKYRAFEDQNFINILLQLDILINRENVIRLSSGYVDLLEPIISDTVAVITPEDFVKSEAEKKEISLIAEKYVLESERKRLLSKDATDQAEHISYVADKNVAAGYDVASFNDKNSKAPNRFIEVKAGKPDPIRFFLSRNEFEVASRLKDHYYIYYVCIKNKKPHELYIFQNPKEGIMRDPKFKVSIDAYEISEK